MYRRELNNRADAQKGATMWFIPYNPEVEDDYRDMVVTRRGGVRCGWVIDRAVEGATAMPNAWYDRENEIWYE